MSNLLKTFKRYFIFAILIVLFVFLLWLRLVVAPTIPQQTTITPSIVVSPTVPPNVPRALLSPEPKIEKSPNVRPDSSLNFKYQGPSFSAPETIPVYKLSKMLTIESGQAKEFAGKFGFTKEPEVEDKDFQGAPSYFWIDQSKKLSIGGSFPAIHFTNSSLLTTNQPATQINEDALLTKAEEELNKLSLENVDFGSGLFSYYKFPQDKNAGLEETKVKEEASLIGVSLTYKIAGFPVISGSEHQLPLFLVFNTQGQLYELLVFLFPSGEFGVSVNTIPFDQVISNLNQEAVLVSAFSKDNLNKIGASPYKLEAVDLSSVKIAYFLPLNFQNTIRPYYAFSGKATDKNSGVGIDVVVLSPATKD